MSGAQAVVSYLFEYRETKITPPRLRKKLSRGPAGNYSPGAPIAASQQVGLSQTDVFFVDKDGLLDVLWVVNAGV